jgi:serine/tyrosine/threonine adenylyltransferase
MTVAPHPGITLEDLHFSNAFAALGERFYETRTPSGLDGARLVAVSPDAAALIDLRADELTRDEFIQIASGTAILRAMQPFAALYGGHQFGVWAGQLGDGRAISLGEITNKRGEPWEIQLKGAGQTAYSRHADGRAVLRSTIREFLASEAMDALGIPTTRALAMVANDEQVIRESIETAAIVVRLAPSFVRFGSFEIFAARGEHDAVRILADYVIDRFYPESGHGNDRYARFFEAVLKRTARLMADWQSVGFMHGVMNTDNFSILGLTLDYGPYGFMEGYEPGHICNHTDHSGRYAFDRQPAIGLWNCYALANALAGIAEPAQLEGAIASYVPTLREAFLERTRAKLGLANVEAEDDELGVELRNAMAAAKSDFTRTFRMLADIRTPAEAAANDGLAQAYREVLFLALGGTPEAAAWIDRYQRRLERETRPAADRATAMNAVNPRIVLRNHLAQEAIDASQAGDDEPVRRLLAALLRPYSDDPKVAAYDRPAPSGQPPIVVSCSS